MLLRSRIYEIYFKTRTETPPRPVNSSFLFEQSLSNLANRAERKSHVISPTLPWRDNGLRFYLKDDAVVIGFIPGGILRSWFGPLSTCFYSGKLVPKNNSFELVGVYRYPFYVECLKYYFPITSILMIVLFIWNIVFEQSVTFLDMIIFVSGLVTWGLLGFIMCNPDYWPPAKRNIREINSLLSNITG